MERKVSRLEGAACSEPVSGFFRETEAIGCGRTDERRFIIGIGSCDNGGQEVS